MARRQLCGGVLAGEHHIQQHAQGIDVGAAVGLGQAELLRGGIAGGAQHHRVGSAVGLDDAAGVKIDEHRLIAPQDHVAVLHVPVHRTQGVEHPQRSAHVLRYPAGLRPREHAALQQERQGIPLDVLLQHGHLTVPGRRLLDTGQMGTVHRQQTAVDIVTAGEPAEYVALARLPVTQQRHGAPGAALQQPHRLKIRLYIAQKCIVHGGPLLYRQLFRKGMQPAYCFLSHFSLL